MSRYRAIFASAYSGTNWSAFAAFSATSVRGPTLPSGVVPITSCASLAAVPGPCVDREVEQRLRDALIRHFVQFQRSPEVRTVEAAHHRRIGHAPGVDVVPPGQSGGFLRLMPA